MADYGYNILVVYSRSDGSFLVDGRGSTGPLGTLTDNESVGIGATTFEVGDGVSISGGGTANSVLGSATINEHLFLFTSTDTEFVFFSRVPDASAFPAFPGNVNGVILNSGAVFPVCFAQGTRIATEIGEAVVEDLVAGDPLRLPDGRPTAVKWIGRQTVSTRFGPAERLMPVRVRAGALGDGLPQRDLTLTADHALLIDGVLINAGALVNGGRIDYVPLSELGDSYTVYHIETENHDVILAEGTPAETYIDYAARRAFDNYAEYVALYGEDRTIPEMEYPRIGSARMLPASLKARLADHAAA